MNIDMLPFTAFALESCSLPAQAGGNARTLTLQLARPPRDCFYEPMAGHASTNQSFDYRSNVLRAAVVPAEGPVLTITF